MISIQRVLLKGILCEAPLIGGSALLIQRVLLKGILCEAPLIGGSALISVG